MEISTRLGHASVHLLAYLPDPTYPPLARALADILDGRNDRVPAICAKLAGARGRGHRATTYAAARRDAAATGRPHVADAMIAAGVVADAGRRPSPPGSTPAGPPTSTGTPSRSRRPSASSPGPAASAWSPTRGGARGCSRPTTSSGLAGLGLAGIEVDHQDHSGAVRAELRGLAARPRPGRRPAPATTTAWARSTTTWAATPRRRSSSSGCCSGRVTPRRRAAGRPRPCSSPDGPAGPSTSPTIRPYLRPIDWNRWSTPDGMARVSATTVLYCAPGTENTRPFVVVGQGLLHQELHVEPHEVVAPLHLHPLVELGLGEARAQRGDRHARRRGTRGPPTR